MVASVLVRLLLQKYPCSLIMPDEATEPEPTKEEQKEPKIRDMTPKKDIKAGAADGKKDQKPTPRRTAEIDFMKYLKDVE